MHIIENRNAKVGRTYCYVGECKWDKQLKKYKTPRTTVGRIEGEPPVFLPNKHFETLLGLYNEDLEETSEHDKLIIETVKAKYGEAALFSKPQIKSKHGNSICQTAWAVFSGPSIVFGSITKRYNIASILEEAFGGIDAQEILSLAWFLASEGDALSNSDAWLNHYETPAGRAISSQDVTKLLDRMKQDGIMTFYKLWLRGLELRGYARN